VLFKLLINDVGGEGAFLGGGASPIDFPSSEVFLTLIFKTGVRGVLGVRGVGAVVARLTGCGGISGAVSSWGVDGLCSAGLVDMMLTDKKER
jgi:hypothetical protein